MLRLPDYEPPHTQRASLAAGLAPLIVLLVFTLLVARVIAPDTAFAAFGACTVWLVHEMWDYQRHVNAYNHEYDHRHLAWRSDDALRAMVAPENALPTTRQYVLRHIETRTQQALLEAQAPRR